MASPRTLTLNIGSQTVSICEFLFDAKGVLTLRRIQTRELLADPAADSSRISQAALAFGEIADALRVKKMPVHCALPAHAVFSRFVKLAFVEPGKLQQTIEFEAQQNIPYPLAEVVWGHKTLSQEDAPQPEVLIVAGKKELLEDWSSAVRESGLLPTGFELAPLALYNAFRYNYGESAECSLLIDLGSRTTNLIFIEKGRFFVRVIASGGTAVTSAVAKEFSENFTAAESRKRSDGFVALGANHADHPDPELAKLSKVLRNALTRLHAEIARSISFYRSQQGGSAPAHVFVCGGGANLAMVCDFMAEKLGVSVEIFNPLRCVRVGDQVDRSSLADLAPLLGENVGLALRSALQCPLDLNLVPPSATQSALQKSRILATSLCGLALCAPLLAWGYHFGHTRDLATQMREEQEPLFQNLTKVEERLRAGQKTIDQLLQKAKPLQDLVRDRQYWTALIHFIHSKLPSEKIWITGFDVPPPQPEASSASLTRRKRPQEAVPIEKKDLRKRLELKGLYMENPKGVGLVHEFGANLKGSPFFEVASQQEWSADIKNNPTEWAQEFSIPLLLNVHPAPSVNFTPQVQVKEAPAAKTQK